MAADISQRIALALQGFGAGVQGQGPYFQHMLNQQNQELSQERKMAGIQDAYSVMRNLQAGNIPTARKTLINRLGLIKQLGGDPSDTMELLQQIESGNVEAALNEVSSVVNYAQAVGMLKLPQNAQPKTQIVNGQAVTIDPSGKATAAPIEGFTQPQPKQVMPKTQVVDGQVITIDPSTGQATAAPVQGFKKDRTDINLRLRDQSLREKDLALRQQAEARMANKMSAGLESQLFKADNDLMEAQNDAANYELLANDYETKNPPSGIKAKFLERLKFLSGTQDSESEMIRKFNKYRMAEVIKDLPTGQTTDKDIEVFSMGVPPENASTEQKISFLKGAAKAARLSAAHNQYKSDFISKKGDGRGLNQAWRAKVTAPALKREVSIAEIYETAQNRGTAPEDVMQQLGIKEEDVLQQFGIKGLPY